MNKDGTLIASIPMVDDGTGLDITFGEMAWDNQGKGEAVGQYL
jgi:hypothetical protein